eukprot:symbB.v1.2.036588.t2/scaffold5200.1/size29896/1
MLAGYCVNLLQEAPGRHFWIDEEIQLQWALWASRELVALAKNLGVEANGKKAKILRRLERQAAEQAATGEALVKSVEPAPMQERQHSQNNIIADGETDLGQEKEEEAQPVEIESKAEENVEKEKEEEAQPVEIESKEEEHVEEEKEELQPVQGKEEDWFSWFRHFFAGCPCGPRHIA